MSKIFRLSFWVTLLFFLPFLAVAQNYTVRGKITDERTKDPLIGVPVAVTEKLSTGVFTNQDGEYKITLPKGEYTLVVKYVGYEDKKVKISLTKDIIENVSLKSSSIDLNEVVVSSRRADENVAGVQTGVEKMSIQEINQLPVLFGERDVVKAIQLMPGVKSAGEGGTGFYVRGGSADQNLVLLDNVGSLENKGLELTLGGTPLKGDFTWNTSANISFNRSEVTQLLNDMPMAIKTNTGGGYNIYSSSFSF